MPRYVSRPLRFESQPAFPLRSFRETMKTRFKSFFTAIMTLGVLAFFANTALSATPSASTQSLSSLFGEKSGRSFEPVFESGQSKGTSVDFGIDPVYRGQKTDNGRFWTNFFYSGSSLKPKGEGRKIKPDLYGFQLGLDIPRSASICSIYFLNIGRSNTDFEKDARSKIGHYQLGFGKRIDWGRRAYVGYTGSLTYDDYKIRDRLSNRQYSGDGVQANLSGEAALCWNGAEWSFRPFYALQYDFLYHGRLGKAGSAILGDSNDHSLQQYMGLRFTKNFQHTIDWQIRASWVHQMLKHTPPFTSSRFSSISGTSVPTPAVPFFDGNIGRDWAWLGTGVCFDFYNWYLFLDYDLMINGRQNSHVASLFICLTW